MICSHILAIVNHASVNMKVWKQVFEILLSILWEYIFRNGILGLYSGSVLIFFWKCHTIWHTGSTILQPYLQHAKVPISLCPCQHLFYMCIYIYIYIYFFFNNSHPKRCEVIPHSGFDLLIIRNIDNVYIYPLATCVFTEKCPFNSLAYFLSGLLTHLCFCSWVVGILYIFWTWIPCQTVGKYLLPLYWLLFHFISRFLCCAPHDF